MFIRFDYFNFVSSSVAAGLLHFVIIINFTEIAIYSLSYFQSSINRDFGIKVAIIKILK